MIFMVCYDISDPKRLHKTAKVLENIGLRVQKSFFQCDIQKEKMEELHKRISDIIDSEEDSFFIYPLCEDCSKRAITDGSGSLIRLEGFEIL